MELLAHISEDRKQSLKEHCLNVANYAKDCLETLSLCSCAYLAGLLHDMGKATKIFNDYLAGNSNKSRGSVIHTFQGCRYLLEKYHNEDRDQYHALTAELLAYSIGAHHGLFDCVNDNRKSGFQHRLEKEAPEIDYKNAKDNFINSCISENEIDKIFEEAVTELKPIIDKISDDESIKDDELSFYFGMLSRLILSALIEGDRRDTAEFMTGKKALLKLNNNISNGLPRHLKMARNDDFIDIDEIWEARLDYMETKLEKLPSDTLINKARQYISKTCKDFAEQKPDVYRLNVPTGGGKTLSSLRFALAHAKKWNKQRIIFTSPLLSIIEQNSKIIKEYIGDDSIVLEHHSNVVKPQDNKDELEQMELLTESWSSPIIITTLVQLLNTLFSGKTASIRRFQALCNSVIVIDEVQTVPNKMLTLFNLAVNFLLKVCNATVVLCSATQPCLEEVKHSLSGSLKQMVEYNEEIWNVFKRTNIIDAGSKRLEEIPELIKETLEEADSLLVVCNKKSEAEYIFREFCENDEISCFHLSASMCVKHRRKELDDLKIALEDSKDFGNKTLCISTQVIEAGVDISFQSVIRFSAGMDNVIQAAGRCNRNGEFEEIQNVRIIRCSDEKLNHLEEIQKGKDATEQLLYRFENNPELYSNMLESDEAIKYYYKSLYSYMSEGYQDFSLKNYKTSIFDLLSNNEKFADENCEEAENYGLRQAFKIAGQNFDVFDSFTFSVIVPYEDGKELIADLCSEKAQKDLNFKIELVEKIKEYSVSVYNWQKEKLIKDGAVFSVLDNSILVLREDFYDKNLGLVTNKTSEQEFLEV